MARRVPKYPRYVPTPVRPPGAGAFFDFAAHVTRGEAVKLKSSSLPRRFGKLIPAGS